MSMGLRFQDEILPQHFSDTQVPLLALFLTSECVFASSTSTLEGPSELSSPGKANSQEELLSASRYNLSSVSHTLPCQCDRTIPSEGELLMKWHACEQS